MNKIYYFSGSGKSFRLASYFEKVLGFPLVKIANKNNAEDLECETAVLVFPVYCQNLPDPVKDFLPQLKAKNIAVAALYGKKSFGNVIYDVSELTNADFIAGVCIPTGHSFLSENDDFNTDALSPFIDKIKSPSKANIVKSKKSFYADLIPAQRTQIAVKIIRSDSCKECRKCIENCPMDAINNDFIINKNCIRCLKCISECPEKALSFSIHPILKFYLVNGRKNKLKFYL